MNTDGTERRRVYRTLRGQTRRHRIKKEKSVTKRAARKQHIYQSGNGLGRLAFGVWGGKEKPIPVPVRIYRRRIMWLNLKKNLHLRCFGSRSQANNFYSRGMIWHLSTDKSKMCKPRKEKQNSMTNQSGSSPPWGIRHKNN